MKARGNFPSNIASLSYESLSRRSRRMPLGWPPCCSAFGKLGRQDGKGHYLGNELSFEDSSYEESSDVIFQVYALAKEREASPTTLPGPRPLFLYRSLIIGLEQMNSTYWARRRSSITMAKEAIPSIDEALAPYLTELQPFGNVCLQEISSRLYRWIGIVG